MQKVSDLLTIFQTLAKANGEEYLREFDIVTSEQYRVVFKINGRHVKFLKDDRAGYIYRADSYPRIRTDVYEALRDLAAILMYKHNAELRKNARLKKAARIKKEREEETRNPTPVQGKLSL